MLRLAAALVHADAGGPNVRTLLDVAEALDLKLPELDASSTAGQLAERVRAARASVDRVLGDLVEARAGGRRRA